MIKDQLTDKSTKTRTGAQTRRRRLSLCASAVLVLFGYQARGENAPDLSIQELRVFQTKAQAGVRPRATFAFKVTNSGGAINAPFRTTISSSGSNDHIDTIPLDGKPSTGANETMFFSKTRDAPTSGPFTVKVTVDSRHQIAESDEGNNSASETSSIDSPPVNQWYWVGPTEFTGERNSTGRLIEVVLGPDHPNVMFTRGEEAAQGIWKTSDGGATWRNISLSMPNPAHPSLAIAPNDFKRLYALTLSDGLFRTTDGGESWKQIASAAIVAGRVSDSGQPHELVISPNNAKALFFGGSDGIYRSTDGGYTWTPSSAPYLQVKGKDGTAAKPFSLVLDPANGDTLYTVLVHADPNAAGLYRTQTATSDPSTVPQPPDPSSPWKKMGQCPGSALPAVSPNFLAVVPPIGLAPTQLFVIYGTSPVRLFKSTGICTNPFKVTDLVFREVTIVTPPPAPLFGFTVKPTDPSKLIVGGFPRGSSFNYRSVDGGRHWTRISTGHGDLKSYTWNTMVNPPVVIAASDGGLHKSSDDGNSWTLLSGGAQNGEFYNIKSIGPFFDLVGGTQDNGNVRSNRFDTRWQDFTGGDGGRVETFQGLDFLEFKEIIFSTDQYPASMQKTTNGVSVDFGQGLPDAPNCRQVNIKAIPKRFRLFFLTFVRARVFVPCQRLYWRDNDGVSTTWKSIFPPLGGNQFRINYNMASDTLFLGTDTGKLWAGTNASAADPATGIKWTLFFSLADLRLGAAAITDIQFDPANIAVFVSTNAGSGGRVIRLDYAQTTPPRVKAPLDITANLPGNLPVNAIAFDRATFNALWIATEDGVFKGTTSDAKTYSWSALRRGMGHNVNVTGLIPWVDNNGFRALAASVYGRSVFAVRVEP